MADLAIALREAQVAATTSLGLEELLAIACSIGRPRLSLDTDGTWTSVVEVPVGRGNVAARVLVFREPDPKSALIQVIHKTCREMGASE